MVLGHKTDVSKPLHLLADGIAKRGMVVLISDLLDDPERVVDGLRHFRFRGTDVIVFHVHGSRRADVSVRARRPVPRPRAR